MKDENDVTGEQTGGLTGERRVPGLLRNYISFIGFAVIAASLTSFVLLLLVGLGSIDNPYTDLITFIFVPSILGFGIFVVLVGALWERHRRRNKSNDEIAAYPI